MNTFTAALNPPLQRMCMGDWVIDCTKMDDWQRVYNVADVEPFIEAFGKMAEECYPYKIDVCKDAVSISGILMMYVLNKSLEKKHKD